MSADRLQVVHVVEGGDGHAVRRRLVERVGDLAERLRREPAVPLLREPKRRQGGGARDRIQRPDLLDLVIERLFLRAHRSTSPMTASSEPTTAIRSATAASCTQAAVACRAANEGARNLTRHGFGPPSETR